MRALQVMNGHETLSAVVTKMRAGVAVGQLVLPPMSLAPLPPWLFDDEAELVLEWREGRP